MGRTSGKYPQRWGRTLHRYRLYLLVEHIQQGLSVNPMHTGALPAEETVTFYAHSSVYWVRRPEPKQVVMVGISPVIGDDPMTDDDVKVIAIRQDRVEWDESAYGPYRDAKLIGFGVARLIEDRHR